MQANGSNWHAQNSREPGESCCGHYPLAACCSGTLRTPPNSFPSLIPLSLFFAHLSTSRCLASFDSPLTLSLACAHASRARARIIPTRTHASPFHFLLVSLSFCPSSFPRKATEGVGVGERVGRGKNIPYFSQLGTHGYRAQRLERPTADQQVPGSDSGVPSECHVYLLPRPVAWARRGYALTSSSAALWNGKCKCWGPRIQLLRSQIASDAVPASLDGSSSMVSSWRW